MVYVIVVPGIIKQERNLSTQNHFTTELLKKYENLMANNVSTVCKKLFEE